MWLWWLWWLRWLWWCLWWLWQFVVVVVVVVVWQCRLRWSRLWRFLFAMLATMFARVCVSLCVSVLVRVRVWCAATVASWAACTWASHRTCRWAASASVADRTLCWCDPLSRALSVELCRGGNNAWVVPVTAAAAIRGLCGPVCHHQAAVPAHTRPHRTAVCDPAVVGPVGAVR
jgi:hypothetical protein